MITVIGLGEQGTADLSGAAKAVILGAEVLVGAPRHLAEAQCGAEKIVWPSPFSKARPLFESLSARRVVVLATGDPMWFGVGATLARWFGAEAINVIPHAGVFSLAAARLGWALQDCLCLSAHGRPLDALALHFQPGRKLLILGRDRTTPRAVQDLLKRHGRSASIIRTLEHLGGAFERIGEVGDDHADLVTLAVTVALDPGARALALVPGLPDDAFQHDGRITKRDIRAATLAALAPLPGEMLWDIGAGAGSVAIEWMRAGGVAVAIESSAERCARIALNANALGVPGLAVITGTAPKALPQTIPDAVFVGGGVTAPGVLEQAWAALKTGGRLVANAVTAEGEATLLAFAATHGGTMTRLMVQHLEPVGGFHSWVPARPVTRYAGIKA